MRHQSSGKDSKVAANMRKRFVYFRNTFRAKGLFEILCIIWKMYILWLEADEETQEAL